MYDLDSAALLDERTLVLNRSWAVVSVTTVRRALGMVYRRVARVIAPETYETHDFDSWATLSSARGGPCVRTVSLQIRVPEAVVLLRYDGLPQARVPFSRKNLFRRDNFTCQYCGHRRPAEDLSIDHLVPRARGGRSSWENCVLACLECNLRKGDGTPEGAGLRLIRKPSRPRWAPYLSVAVGRRKASWDRFVSERYWNVELEP
jgi:5-methylcytosine-specific restriction endonuclease McrA